MTTTRVDVRRVLALAVSLVSGLTTAASASPAEPAWTVRGGTADVAHSRLVVTGGTVTATTAYVTLAGEVVGPGGVEDDAAPEADTGNGGGGDDAAPGATAPGGADADGGESAGVRLAAAEISLDGVTGTLRADVATPVGPDTTATTHAAVEVGTIDLAAHPLAVSGDRATVDGAPVTLTAAGAAAVGAEPGDALGPLTLDLELAPSVLHPQDVVVHAGEDAHFTAAVADHPEEVVRWQGRPDPATPWQDLPNASGASLVLPAVDVAQDGTQVRAVVATEPDAVSDVATLTVPTPTLEVLAADGVTPLGAVRDADVIVVKGRGFGAAANVGGTHGPVPGHLPQGTVVALGTFTPQWRPSDGAPAEARTSSTEVRALAEDVLAQVPAQEQEDVREQWVALGADGTFTAELTVTTPVAGWPQDGRLGVYTYPAGGVVNADQELEVPLELVSADQALPPPVDVAPGPEPGDAVAAPAPTDPPEDLPEWPPALRSDAAPVPDPAPAVTNEPPAEVPVATTGEGVSTFALLVVVVLLAAALVTGTRERG